MVISLSPLAAENEVALNSLERQYAYRPGSMPVVFGTVFFGLGTLFLGAEAWHNERGLVIERIIELGLKVATAFYWVCCGCCGGAWAFFMFLAWHQTVVKQRLVFGATAMRVPASRWSAEEKEIAYRDISAIAEAQFSGQRFLYVIHSSGKFIITSAWLPSKAAFDEIYKLLAAKINAVRTTR